MISTDSNIHIFEYLAKAVQGNNTLTIGGAGESDGLGMTVDNVCVVDTSSNLIKNGGFDTNLDYWTVSPGPNGEINSGQTYSDLLPPGNNVIELDFYQNENYSQTIQMPSEEFVSISFQYAARTKLGDKPISTNGMKVFWNGV